MAEEIKTEKLNIFFDESGKRKDKPTLMGGMSIPAVLYNTAHFSKMSQKLRDGEINLHWKEYSGHATTRENIRDAISLITNHGKFIKCTVINYDFSLIEKKGFASFMAEQMIYTKFPERIIYGLLRRYGKNLYIEADIKVEKSREYEDFKLNEVMKEQLNIQSIYRGEQFIIKESELIPKREEIGIELTDLLLGLMRTVILNKPSSFSNTVRFKNELVIDLIKNDKFYSFLENIRFFEWTHSRELTEVNFSDYLQLFIANNYDQYLMQ
ncbi:hypothetical protein FHS18_000781 [Paenibacillus phyllosphaerae]|uniref:DUF3800 domain-containing protein n=1 Tax=Paenibacillus phyllosphaerae TaxID=274593 RepID=A0A7W5AU03_9BACL|nr:DUF3800 domain-containing protein [Paenibacillus phyllosphaerae]MBB3108753.1 hypothetical protein [Paenibacillus phyllosphaerae]